MINIHAIANNMIDYIDDDDIENNDVELMQIESCLNDMMNDNVLNARDYEIAINDFDLICAIRDAIETIIDNNEMM